MSEAWQIKSWQYMQFKRSVDRATDQTLESRVIYGYKNHIASWMREETFKFIPVFRDNLKTPSHRRCDYKLSVNIDNRNMSITIEI